MEATAESRVRAKLALVRDVLGMDIAMVTEVRDHEEVARYAAGQWPGVGDVEGAGIALEETFCGKLIEGDIPNWIGDVAGDERVADLQMARGLGVGAWIGTLLRGPNERLYVLCALSRATRSGLGSDDVRVLRAFVESILPYLAAAEWPVGPLPAITRVRRISTTLVIDFAAAVARQDVDDLLQLVHDKGGAAELETSYEPLTRRLTVHARSLEAMAALDKLARFLTPRHTPPGSDTEGVGGGS